VPHSTILRIGLFSLAVGAIASALTIAIFEAPSPAIFATAAPTEPTTTRAFTVESAAAITLAGALEASSPVRASADVRASEMTDLPAASEETEEVRIPDRPIQSTPAETAREDPVTTGAVKSQDSSKALKQSDRKGSRPSQRRRKGGFASPDHNRGKVGGREIRPNSGEWGWP